MSSLMSTKRTVRSRSWASSSHGDTLASWSSFVQRISSPGLEVPAGGAREREAERGHVRAEDGLLGRQPRKRAAVSRARCVERLGAAARLVRPADVRVRLAQVGGDRVDHLVRHLGAAGGVEEDEVALECAEPGADGGDVEAHARRFSHARQELAFAFGGQPGLAGPLGDVPGGLGERPEGEPGADRAVHGDELEGGEARRRSRESSRAGRSSLRRPARPGTPPSTRRRPRTAGLEHRVEGDRAGRRGRVVRARAARLRRAGSSSRRGRGRRSSARGGPGGREDRPAALGPARPVGEAVGRVVRADDQPRPHEDRRVAERSLRPPVRTAPSAHRSWSSPRAAGRRACPASCSGGSVSARGSR